MKRILIAEDELRVAVSLTQNLRVHGFTTAVAPNGREALHMALSSEFDLLILDIGLPLKNGWAVLREIRGQGNTIPIIILSALRDVESRVTGLEGGADDYLVKPFNFEELLARVRLRLKPSPFQHPSRSVFRSTRLTVGEISLDLYTHQVWVHDRLVELSTREFKLLEVLMRQPGKALSREQLLRKIWGYDYDPGSNVVDVYVRYLRKKLGTQAIETIRGFGYCLQCKDTQDKSLQLGA